MRHARPTANPISTASGRRSTRPTGTSRRTPPRRARCSSSARRHAVAGGLGVVDGGDDPLQTRRRWRKRRRTREPAQARSGDQVLSAGRAARDLHALSVPDHPGPEAHHDGLRVRGRGPHHLHGRSTRRRPPTAGWDGRTATGKGKRWSSTRRVSTIRPGSTAPGISTATRCTSSNAYTAASPDHLLYEATIEDPKVFTRPWKISMPLYRRLEKNAQIMEFRCVEFVEELIYGHLRKQPSNDREWEISDEPSISRSAGRSRRSCRGHRGCRRCPLPARRDRPRARRRRGKLRRRPYDRAAHAGRPARSAGLLDQHHVYAAGAAEGRHQGVLHARRKRSKRIKKAAAAKSEQTEPGTVADVHYDFTQFGLDRSQGALALNLRTSLIVDPPDGRLPPLTAEGQKRAAERAEARKRMGGPYDAVQNQPLSVALHHHGSHRAADAGGAYNNNYQIVQVPGLRDDSRRDDPRRPHHPAGRPPAAAGKRPSVDGKLPRPLGGRDAGRRDDEFQRTRSRSRDPARTCG